MGMPGKGALSLNDFGVNIYGLSIRVFFTIYLDNVEYKFARGFLEKYGE